ncbi:MAG: FHA domain-containing protein [Planctomycetota bacterium]
MTSLPEPLAPAPATCALRIERDGTPRWRLRLNAQVTVVGRDPKLAGCLNDPGVSRRHAVFVVAPGGAVVVHDLGSRNGIYLNERRIPPGAQVRLASGDALRLGSTVLRVESLAARRTSAPQRELVLDEVQSAPPRAPRRGRRRRLRARP